MARAGPGLTRRVVGGTTPGISKTDRRLFETGWPTGFSLLVKVSGKYEWEYLVRAGALNLWFRPVNLSLPPSSGPRP